MTLTDLIDRPPRPEPWQEGDNIPWHDSGFSRRMLAEHLSQEHDAASRRAAIIDRHVAWIDAALLQGRPARVLDLGCGPGLYTARLARLGHECIGVDWSPASIAYARAEAERDGLRCRYVEADVREAQVDGPFGLAMMLFGELNVFSPSDARCILGRARRAMAAGGWLLLEPHTFAAVREIAAQGRRWTGYRSGLFSDLPHLLIEEHAWDAPARAATTRFYVVDAGTAEVTRHARTMQAYSEDEYRSVLLEAGFVEPRIYPSLTGEEDGRHPGLFALTARVPGL